MVSFQFYDPSDIFTDNSHPEGMAGKNNIALAKSFFHSRNYSEKYKHQCNSTHDRSRAFDRNAGAVQLYKKNGKDIYQISEQLNNKEYHCISYGNKNFKEYTKDREGYKATSYGHSERILMRDILDDLILANHPDKHEILRPSDDLHCQSSSATNKEYEVLRYLTNNPGLYKQYLGRNNIIVKIWSERPACSEESNGITVGGSNCTQFIKDICTEGSQFGFIVKDYTRNDNKGSAPKIENAFEAFEKAYIAAIAESADVHE